MVGSGFGYQHRKLNEGELYKNGRNLGYNESQRGQLPN